MTEFGRRIGEGDMKKSVYDADENGVVDETPAHASSHESAGTDEIDITGLTGTTPRAILGDSTAGRVLRQVNAKIEDGTDANTIKCTLTSYWNATGIAATDNISKGSTTGSFTLQADGKKLTIEASGLDGNVLFAQGNIWYNSTPTAYQVALRASGNDITIEIYEDPGNTTQDLTALVDTGTFHIIMLYATHK